MLKRITFVMVTVFILFGSLRAADLEIHVINVGQGDCFFIKSPSGNTCLIDAGENNKGNDIC